MANSDSATGGFSESVIITVWILFFAAFTLLAQWWLKNKTQGQLTRYMQIAVLASFTVWFALEVNLTLKELWGRYRPYELTAGNHEFTNWLTINGVNGHKSFPSRHTMAATLFMVRLQSQAQGILYWWDRLWCLDRTEPRNCRSPFLL